MKKYSVFLVLFVALVVNVPALAGRPVHSVHVGGPDACEGFVPPAPPGCDANFSLVALLRADDRVSGRWTDIFVVPEVGTVGLHLAIDCLAVDGNKAWVSGLVTHENLSGDGSLVGLRGSAMVQDNGVTANDLPDQISFTLADPGNVVCTQQLAVPLFDMPQGQVEVK